MPLVELDHVSGGSPHRPVSDAGAGAILQDRQLPWTLGAAIHPGIPCKMRSAFLTGMMWPW